MTSQQHADHLLAIYQQRRSLPPRLRLVDAPPLVPDDYEETLADVAAEMARDV
jgi:hypothetical protein